MVSANHHARASQMTVPIISKFQAVFHWSSPRSPFSPVYGCGKKSRPHATIETSALLWARWNWHLTPSLWILTYMFWQRFMTQPVFQERAPTCTGLLDSLAKWLVGGIFSLVQVDYTYTCSHNHTYVYIYIIRYVYIHVCVYTCIWSRSRFLLPIRIDMLMFANAISSHQTMSQVCSEHQCMLPS